MKQTSESQKLESKGELTKSLSDTSLSLLIEKGGFSTSKVTEWNELMALESLAKMSLATERLETRSPNNKGKSI